MASGNVIGNEAAFQHRNFVAQAQLTFFQSGQLELIGKDCLGKRDDRTIKVAMLDPQAFESLLDLLDAHYPTIFPASSHRASLSHCQRPAAKQGP